MVALSARRKAQGGAVSEQVANLSTTGLLLVSRSALKKGDAVELELSAPNGKLTVPVRGRVAWARPLADEWDLGVSFTNVTASELEQLELLMTHVLATPQGRRSSVRFNLDAPGFWRTAGASQQPVTLSNLSLNGASISTPSPPHAGERGLLSLSLDEGLLAVPAAVAWSGGGRAGLSFDAAPVAAEFVARMIRAFLLVPGQRHSLPPIDARRAAAAQRESKQWSDSHTRLGAPTADVPTAPGTDRDKTLYQAPQVTAVAFDASARPGAAEFDAATLLDDRPQPPPPPKRLDLSAMRATVPEVRGPRSSPSPAAPGELGPGAQLGRYTVLGPLATGGMARIWLARERGSERVVVLKTLLDPKGLSNEAVQMFLQEARIIAMLSHRSIARIYEVGFELDHPFIAMEYVAGRTLEELVTGLSKNGQLMPSAIAARIVSECCSGVHDAHVLQGPDGRPLTVVHRDVKPRNVVISYTGEVKLIDFGIAKTRLSQDFTAPGTVRGTVTYLAPEQARGEPASPAVDLWALGVLLYWLLTGHLPFDGKDDLEIMRAIIDAAPARPSERRYGVAPELERITLGALKKEPQDRFASAEAMARALDVFLLRHESTQAQLAALMNAVFPAGVDPGRLRVEALLAR